LSVLSGFPRFDRSPAFILLPFGFGQPVWRFADFGLFDLLGEWLFPGEA